MYKLNGKALRIGRAFTHAEVQYPSNWLQLSTEEDRNALGITWEADPVRHDDRYYWNGELNNPKALEDKEEVDEDGNPLYVQVLDNTDPDNPVMVDSDERLVTKGLKSNMIAQVQDTAGKLLAQTDWYVVRKNEKDVAIPADVTTTRDAIRTECDRLETAIAGASDVEALIEVMNSQNWGE